MRDDSSSPSKHDRIVGILQHLSTDQIRVGTVRRFIKIAYGQMVNAQGLDEYAFLRHDRAAAALPGQGELDFLADARVVGLKPAHGGYTKTKQIVIVDMNAVEDDVDELVRSFGCCATQIRETGFQFISS